MIKLLLHSSKEKNCEYCGKLFFKKRTTAKCCSVSCAVSCAQKKRFENPEAREKHTQVMKECHGTPEARKKQSQAMKKHFETPGAREKNSQAQKKCQGTPEAREKQSQVQINKRSCFYTLDQLIKNDYCLLWTEELRMKIRTRDNFTCMECGKVQEKRNFSVHHIHYKKEDCYPDLLTLCPSCHVKANFDRNYWENRFMNKINDLGLLFWLQYNKD